MRAAILTIVILLALLLVLLVVIHQRGLADENVEVSVYLGEIEDFYMPDGTLVTNNKLYGKPGDMPYPPFKFKEKAAE